MTYEYMGGLGALGEVTAQELTEAINLTEVLNARVYAVMTAATQADFQDRYSRLQQAVDQASLLIAQNPEETGGEWGGLRNAFSQARQYFGHVTNFGFAGRDGVSVPSTVTTASNGTTVSNGKTSTTQTTTSTSGKGSTPVTTGSATRANIQELQRYLVAAGHSVGSTGVDGVWGPNTRAAVVAMGVSTVQARFPFVAQLMAGTSGGTSGGSAGGSAGGTPRPGAGSGSGGGGGASIFSQWWFWAIAAGVLGLGTVGTIVLLGKDDEEEAALRENLLRQYTL